MSQKFYIIAGPNGSGKTTLAKELVREDKITFLNADELAKSHKDTLGIKAGRLLLDKLTALLNDRVPIVWESTISGNLHRRVIERARKAKYEIIFIYVFLESVEQNLERIKQRVALGGHNVPDCDVRRRYGRSLNNFWSVIPMVSYWELYYNGGTSYKIVARGKGEFVEIADEAVYNKFKRYKNDKI
ncbi:AAA family ATPase [bacterium]|nr:AAA family ATPase [bacterium]